MYISISLFLVVGALHWQHNSSSYLHSAGCAVTHCVCVSRYSGRSSVLWTAGFGEGFFLSQDGFIYYTHTHTHIKKSREGILWCLHLAEGGIWREAGVVQLRCGTVRVEWLVFKSTSAKQIFISLNLLLGGHNLTGSPAKRRSFRSFRQFHGWRITPAKSVGPKSVDSALYATIWTGLWSNCWHCWCYFSL